MIIFNFVLKYFQLKIEMIFASIAEAARSIDGNTSEANRARIKRGQPCIDKKMKIYSISNDYKGYCYCT